MTFKSCFLFIFCLLTGFKTWAQDLSSEYQVKLYPKILQLDNPAGIDSILQIAAQGHFDQSEDLGIADLEFEYWFEIDFAAYADLLVREDSIYFYPGAVEISHLYLNPAGQIRELSLTLMGDHDLKRNKYQNIHYLPIAVNDLFDGSKIYVKSRYLRVTPDLSKKIFAFSTPDAHRLFAGFISPTSFKIQVLAYFFLGVAAVLMVFNLILFFYVKEYQFIYYGAFLLFQLIYYSRISPSLADYFGYDFPWYFFWLTTVSQLLINLFYLLFIRYFLEFKRVLPAFDRIVRAIAWLLMGLIVINSSIIFFNPYSLLQSQLMDGQRYFMAGFAFVGIIYLWFRYPNKLKYFVIAGTLIFTTGALMTMFLLRLDYMITGSAIESTIFALGLSYKIKTINQEKQNAEKDAFKTKLGALRAQINPHFIFNSLSSIQHLINSGQKEAALSYLTKFSKFVRQVLENSIDVQVTLEKEIELLRVYLDLESLRFDHSFSFQIEFPEHSDLRYQEVPMLIVQPFVENAIKHGLMPKQTGERKVWIRFQDRIDHILCEVEDNGIGRAASAAAKGTNQRPSRGMTLTEERLKMVNGVENQHQILIEDLPQGTKISIKLPKL
jgi:signal transduction histidine kinase